MKTLEQVTKDLYWLGKVTKLETIGKYQVAAYIDENGKELYHPYYDGKDIGQTFESLDRAIVGIIAERHEGGNTRAADYFFRIIENK